MSVDRVESHSLGCIDRSGDVEANTKLQALLNAESVSTYSAPVLHNSGRMSRSGLLHFVHAEIVSQIILAFPECSG
jgi:hypothetical protein